MPHEGDHFRTRLTHTIEVGQIARALARALRLDEDLAEALALAHDLGHAPFGHAGEDALDEVMAPWGGFDHNAQTLRIVTRLERRYAAFDGLNLVWETLEGLVKHNGPVLDRAGRPVGRYVAAGAPRAILDYDARRSLELWSQASGEAQAAAIADGIAYNAHDLDDGLRAGLFDVDALADVGFLDEIHREIASRHGALERPRLVNEIVRRVITRFVEDAIAESARRLAAAAPAGVEALRALSQPVVAFSPAIAAADEAVRAFLLRRMYRHPNVTRVRDEALSVVRALFARLRAAPAQMPDEWARRSVGADEAKLARLVCDYIAGMTDRYALGEHRRLFGQAPDLR